MSKREEQPVYVDLAKATTREYFEYSTRDTRFTWEEIQPSRDDNRCELSGDRWVWADGTGRWRLTGCAHTHREDGVCSTCGDGRS